MKRTPLWTTNTQYYIYIYIYIYIYEGRIFLRHTLPTAKLIFGIGQASKVKCKSGNRSHTCNFVLDGNSNVYHICHYFRYSSRLVHGLDLVLHNGPRSTVIMPIESQHSTSCVDNCILLLLLLLLL